MSIDLIVLLPSITASFLLGAFVLLRNTHARINRIFIAFTSVISIWSVCNYLADHAAPEYTLVFTRATFLFGALIGYLASKLSCYFPNEVALAKRRLNTIEPFAVGVVALLSMTPLVVAGARKGVTGAEVQIGPLYIIFLAYILLVLVTVIYNFTVQYKIAASIAQRMQIKSVLSGIFLYGIFAIASNLVLPIFIDSWASSRYGPIFVLFMVSLVGFAIVKHGLFDIRLTVARTIAYLLSLSFIGVTYGFVIITISSLPILERQPQSAQRLEYVFLALFTAILYPWVRRFFARITDRILYQDNYDPQAFLGELNQALVNNIHLEKLLTTAASTIAERIKAEYCLFGIKETGFKDVRIFGTVKKNFDPLDIVTARHATPHLGTNIIVTDFLPPEADKLKHVLVRNDIAMLVRLVPEFASSKDGVEGLGYILLGRKKSGNTYATQDIRIMSIIANELVIAVQNALHFEEIQRFNVTLQKEITDATRKLRRTNQRLIELDETKDDFISMASHQLRTPLTSVKGYLSMVLEGDAGKLNDTQTKMLSQAFTSSQRMVYLITDLLNVSRLKTGKFVIDPAPVDLSTMIQGEIAQLTETAQAKNLELTYQKPASFPKLMLDETKTRQVIMNFIDNAIYYTPEGGHIRIELTDKPATVELRVVDDGIGVPKGEQHHLFTKFYRAANARKARPDGTGLGLFMAKKVIIAQGGSVLFESKENQGSTFGFVFSKSKLKVTTGTGPEKPAPSEAAKALAAAEV